MIPLRDVIPSRRAPWLTLALIAASLVVLFAAGHGWIATIANLVALWIFGDNVEDQLGRPKFAFIFVLGAAVAAALFLWLTTGPPPWPVMVTGGIAGVTGAYLLIFPTSRVHMLVVVPFRLDLIEIPALLIASIWLFVQALTSEPAWFLTTMGGAIVGAAAALVLRPARDEYWTATAYGGEPRGKQARVQ